jgi:hypothetical protein
MAGIIADQDLFSEVFWNGLHGFGQGSFSIKGQKHDDSLHEGRHRLA